MIAQRRGWRPWAWRSFLALGGVLLLGALALGVAAGIGAPLPRAHTATLSLRLGQPPEAVWAVLTDPEQAPRWRPDVRAVAPLPPRDGRRAWVEVSACERIAFVEDEALPPRRWVVRIADPTLPFGGRWVHTLRPEDGGTRLTITEEGEVYHPLFRFVSRFVLGHHATIHATMRALAAHFGEAPRIQPGE
jgi:uncharacterized protein YndB with AHSA1/START domain